MTRSQIALCTARVHGATVTFQEARAREAARAPQAEVAETTLAPTPMMASVMSPIFAKQEQTPVIVPVAAAGEAAAGVQILASTPMMASVMSPHIAKQEQTPVIVQQ
jgi:hypothetical protein